MAFKTSIFLRAYPPIRKLEMDRVAIIKNKIEREKQRIISPFTLSEAFENNQVIMQKLKVLDELLISELNKQSL